jgi:hypothetical protein
MLKKASMLKKLIPTMLLTVACASGGPVSAAGALGKAADNAIFAQTLVNEQMSKHPELLVLGMHAPEPGAKESHMIASNLDRIGKEDDEDDLAVAKERKTILAPNMKEPDKFEVAVPLKDSSGKVIGSLSTVFKYAPGDDELKMHQAALAIRDEVARKIPNVAALFKPAH